MKALQTFSPEYLERCQQMTPQEIANFLDQFRQVHGGKSPAKAKSKLISIKIPEDLLQAFRTKAELQGTPYQTQIKKLMRDWLST